MKLEDLPEYTIIKNLGQGSGKKKHDRQIVYFARVNEFVKIGITGDVQARISNICMHCPYDVVLLYTMKGGAKHEANLHRKFKKYHHRGEWYRHEGELKEWLDSVVGAPGLEPGTR